MIVVVGVVVGVVATLLACDFGGGWATVSACRKRRKEEVCDVDGLLVGLLVGLLDEETIGGTFFVLEVVLGRRAPCCFTVLRAALCWCDSDCVAICGCNNGIGGVAVVVVVGLTCPARLPGNGPQKSPEMVSVAAIKVAI